MSIDWTKKILFRVLKDTDENTCSITDLTRYMDLWI